MPRLTLEILEGRTIETKRQLAKEISAAVCELFVVPDPNVFTHIMEIKPENLLHRWEPRSDTAEKAGKKIIYGDMAEPRLTVMFIEGRTQEQKKALVVRLTEILSRILEVEEADVMIYLMEMKKNDFAVGGMFFGEKKPY